MLPSLLTSRLESILGSDFPRVLTAFSQERKGSFRINTLKTDGQEVFDEFREKGILTESFPGIEGAYSFDRVYEYAMKGSRAFYDGKIYLQSISSLIPVLTLAPKTGEMILDVCAAPGSKTTQMSALMHNTGSIFAIDQNQIRFDKLMHNVHLQGATNVHGIKLDAKKYLEGDFEITGDEIHKKGKYAKYVEPKIS